MSVGGTEGRCGEKGRGEGVVGDGVVVLSATAAEKETHWRAKSERTKNGLETRNSTKELRGEAERRSLSAQHSKTSAPQQYPLRRVVNVSLSTSTRRSTDSNSKHDRTRKRKRLRTKSDKKRCCNTQFFTQPQKTPVTVSSKHSLVHCGVGASSRSRAQLAPKAEGVKSSSPGQRKEKKGQNNHTSALSPPSVGASCAGRWYDLSEVAPRRPPNSL